MAILKTFIDLDKVNLITPLIDDGLFTLHLKTSESNEVKIVKFSKSDAKEFILELYRIGKKL